MPTCYVPGCTSGYRKDASSSDRHFFYAPSDLGLRSAWNRAIPRADKELTTKSRVCDLHFHEQDILKTYVHVIDGKTIEIPRGKWSLAKDAVAKVFPNLPAYLSKPPAKKRKPRREITKQTSTETPGQHNDSPCVYLEQPEGSQILDAQKLTIADMKSVELPPGWRMITLAGSDCINFGHYRLLQSTEKEFQLKVVPKLTSSHVNPGKLEKMSVRLATQLFSRSVATGLKFYREQRYPGFEDTQGTENFTLLMNNVFDALNAKCPVAGIYKNSPKIKVIQDFLEMVNTTERTCRSDGTRTFASQMTMESLRVTLMSVLDIITLLHSKDVPYVLTAKLNQDPLERFFGVVRSFGEDEDHPTITHFSQIFRLLSLYTPLKMATKGNCTGEADPVLVAVNDSLSNEKVIALAKKEAREEQLAKVVSQIELREPVAADTLQHSYVRTTAQASALYYLGGYVAKKAHKFTSCEDCLATCVSDGYVPAAAALTEMKSFVPGSLQHPSGALTSMLSSIEHVVQRSTKDNKVFGDLFWSIMGELSECVLTRTTPRRLEPDAAVPPPGGKHRKGAAYHAKRERRALPLE
ncbi:hypothetical protein HPB50_029086 [Hyalomma asiaticum]|nr:hypothetical protein HPB50_029086 [Hyalomma asiaticum]